MAIRFHPLTESHAVVWDDSPITDGDALPGAEVEVHPCVVDGRLAVEQLVVRRRPDGPTVTIDAIKSLPLTAIVSRASRPGPLGGLVSRKVVEQPGSEPHMEYKPLDVLDDHQQAALVYRLAYFLNRPPTLAVGEHFGIAKAAAAKRVQRARELGLLDPTIRGKKGA